MANLPTSLTSLTMVTVLLCSILDLTNSEISTSTGNKDGLQGLANLAKLAKEMEQLQQQYTELKMRFDKNLPKYISTIMENTIPLGTVPVDLSSTLTKSMKGVEAVQLLLEEDKIVIKFEEEYLAKANLWKKFLEMEIDQGRKSTAGKETLQLAKVWLKDVDQIIEDLRMRWLAHPSTLLKEEGITRLATFIKEDFSFELNY